MNTESPTREWNRRDFLRGGSLATAMMLMGGIPIRAEEKAEEDKPEVDPMASVNLNCAVIGCGAWGREILKTLGRLPAAHVLAICDGHEASLRRGAASAPGAEKCADYRQVLRRPDIQAVIVSTPSPLHRGVVLEALAADKHVYCEAPLAASVEDARAIARAARQAPRLNFQSGLQSRADPQRYHLVRFVRTGVMGRTLAVRSQSHKKRSWRLASADPLREKELNWRLECARSPGLIGELGVHLLDVANWFLLEHPVAVSGSGSVLFWNDGRDVPDTIQAVFEYPGGEVFTCHCSLTCSFDSEIELYHGTDSTIMCRERRAWMFREVDSPLLGWEVYARKETFYKESGVVLDANATKQKSLTQKASEDPLAKDETPLHYALKAFVRNSYTLQAGLEDFAANYGDGDTAALNESIAKTRALFVPAAGFKEGYEATVCVLKANEAILQGRRIELAKECFDLG
jgi:predicted dehydrogenase